MNPKDAVALLRAFELANDALAQDRLRSLLNSHPEPIVYHDPETEKPSGEG